MRIVIVLHLTTLLLAGWLQSSCAEQRIRFSSERHENDRELGPAEGRLKSERNEFHHKRRFPHEHRDERRTRVQYKLRHSHSDLKLPGDIPQLDVFKAGEDGYDCFRIPALVFTGRGTVLAFAEGRGKRTRSCSDHGDVHIVVKRSSDNGTSWSNLSVVYEEYPKHTIGNPAPVVEKQSGKVRDDKRVVLSSSTCSLAVDPLRITPQLVTLPTPYT